MIRLAPSILAADFNILGEQISLVEKAGVEYLHVDVMDGNYVPSISFGMPVIASIRKSSKLIFDVHLMILEPIRYVEEFKKAGADLLTVHAEACSDLRETILRIKELGMKVGVSLNPATPLSSLDHILKYVDMVLIMTVNPGFGGQELIKSTMDKVRELRTRAEEQGMDLDIEVDGGITLDNVTEVIDAGANVIVSGTSVFRGDINKNISNFHQVFSNYNKEQGA